MKSKVRVRVKVRVIIMVREKVRGSSLTCCEAVWARVGLSWRFRVTVLVFVFCLENKDKTLSCLLSYVMYCIVRFLLFVCLFVCLSFDLFVSICLFCHFVFLSSCRCGL